MIKQKKGGVLILIVLIVLILLALWAIFSLCSSESNVNDNTAPSEDTSDVNQSAESLIENSIISEEDDVSLDDLI